MTHNNKGIGQNKQNLRAEAEHLLHHKDQKIESRFPKIVFWEPEENSFCASDQDGSPPSSVLYNELLSELHLHQIELEMQNEELLQTQLSLEETRDRYLDLYDFSPVGYITVTREGMITELNLTGAAMFGEDRNKLIRRRFSSLVSLTERDHWHRQFIYILKHGGKHSFEMTLTGGKNKPFHALLNCLKISEGGVHFVRIAIADISDRKKAMEELRVAATAFESQEACIVTDSRGLILQVNQSFINRTGFSKEEIAGNSPMMLQSGRHDSSFFQIQQEELQESKFWQGEVWNRHKNGMIYADWVTISAVIDSLGCISHYVYNFSDISRNKEAEAEIHRLAYYDALTQLPNRRLLLDRIEHALTSSSRSGHFGAIFFLDLDNFKTINDVMGHAVGDELLISVAQRLHDTLRESDTISRIGSTVSRMGGDEFVVVLEDLSSKIVEAAIRARQVAEKLQEALSQPYALSTGDLICTSSFGITIFYKHELKVNKLLKQADLALYKAKKNKGKSFHFFDPTMQAEMDRRSEQEVYLSQALNRNLFQIYYQALTDMEQNIIGVEALLRWKEPNLGMKSPRDIINIAEETGLILPIGEWVLENACSQIKAWVDRNINFPFRLSINFSARQFNHPSFSNNVMKTLEKTGIPPSLLMIEITENVALKNLERTITVMKDLKKLGIGFSLDSFGTGVTSLTSLRRLPVDQLKIDSSLIRKIMANPSEAAIVSSLISIGKTLGIKVHAMGVERQEQLDFLKNQGCDSFQGYLISHPLRLEEFDQVMALMISLQKGE